MQPLSYLFQCVLQMELGEVAQNIVCLVVAIPAVSLQLQWHARRSTVNHVIQQRLLGTHGAITNLESKSQLFGIRH